MGEITIRQPQVRKNSIHGSQHCYIALKFWGIMGEITIRQRQVVSAYQLNSLGISNSCTFGTNSARKVLKSSPWAHHFS